MKTHTEGEKTTTSPGIPTQRQSQIVDSEEISEDELSHDSKTITKGQNRLLPTQDTVEPLKSGHQWDQYIWPI